MAEAPRLTPEFQFIRQIAERARQQVEVHDPYTRDHSVRVANLARQLAVQLPSFDKERLQRLEITALLHDYGKVDVPLEILNHPGRLAPDSVTAVRRHPQLGVRRAAILEDFVELGGILWHHKHYDGGGYPEGDLRGTAIPLEARLIAVADVFDAMTSPRVYHPERKGKSTQEALEEMRRVAGTQLDPSLVRLLEAFLASQTSRMQGSVGFPTLEVMSTLAADVQRARRYLAQALGPQHDPQAPLRDVQDTAAFRQEMMEHLRGLRHSEQSLRNIVDHVCGLPVAETFAPEDVVPHPAPLHGGPHHVRTTLRLTRRHPELDYLGVVVHRQQLWLCVGESKGQEMEVTLVR